MYDPDEEIEHLLDEEDEIDQSEVELPSTAKRKKRTRSC